MKDLALGFKFNTTLEVINLSMYIYIYIYLERNKIGPTGAWDLYDALHKNKNKTALIEYIIGIYQYIVLIIYRT